MSSLSMKKRQKKLKQYYQKKASEQENRVEQLTSKQKYKRKIKYIDKLFFRIFLSSLLLLTFVGLQKNDTFATLMSQRFNAHINFTKIANFFSHKFDSFMPVVGDVTVYSKQVYDSVEYHDNLNKVKNYHFNGVTNLVDGVIIKIVKDSSGRYEITVQASDGYNYIYRGLESCDYRIYSYVSSDSILGLATYNQSYEAYLFDLIIEKEGIYYDFYENAED